MATNPPEFTEPNEQPPEPEPTPWEAWQQAGIDPTYDPQRARNAISFYEDLGNRDRRDYALEQLVRNDLLPEGMSIAEAREHLAQAAQTDPWEALNTPAQPDGYDPNTGEPVYYQQQAPQQPFDPRALQSAIDAEIERRFAARDQADASRRQQEALEAEFRSELDRIAQKHELEPYEVQAIAGQAVQMKPNMPYATTAELVDRSYAEHQKVLDKRLQALAAQQAVGTPQTGMAPTGPPPSTDQVPTNVEEARQMARDFFKN